MTLPLSPVDRDHWPQLIEQVRAGETLARLREHWYVRGEAPSRWLQRELGVSPRLIVRVDYLPTQLDPLAAALSSRPR